MSNSDDFLDRDPTPEPDRTLEFEPVADLAFDPTDPEALADNDPDPETIVHEDPDEEVAVSDELPPDPRLG